MRPSLTTLPHFSDSLRMKAPKASGVPPPTWLPSPVITSAQDGVHTAPDTLHPDGKALDFRGRNITAAQGQQLEVRVQRALGPDYDVDFAGEIGKQATRAGVGSFLDCGLNTASDLQRNYSYRREFGKTGRMMALIVRDFLP